MSESPGSKNLEPATFDTLVLVFLNKGPRHTVEDSPELEARHQGHLRHLKNMRESGKMLLGGPTPDTPERYLRGLCLFYGITLEEVKAWMEVDPQVQAGHFSYQAVTWLVPGGAMSQFGLSGS